MKEGFKTKKNLEQIQAIEKTNEIKLLFYTICVLITLPVTPPW